MVFTSSRHTSHDHFEGSPNITWSCTVLLVKTGHTRIRHPHKSPEAAAQYEQW
jgi:hypothetical protein